MQKTFIPSQSYSGGTSSAQLKFPCQECALRKHLQHCFTDSWLLVIMIVPILIIIK